jgi:monofunctional biosynthetic peptidoglycan transglycosylase
MRQLWRLVGLCVVSTIALQLYFVLRIASMNVFDPASTTFERSEAWRLLTEKGRLAWSQQWVDGSHIAEALQRAVVASEDAGFIDHGGVDWDAMEKAWERNQRAEAQAARRNEAATRRPAVRGPAPTKVVGGSTITQQLAKNLFLSGERTVVRKAQEFVLTLALETLLTKRRILEIYLNHVEWGEGVFGAQAAARHYYRIDASRLGEWPAARLAVMLPAPKRYEQRPNSSYLSERAGTIVARMGDVELP